MLLDEYVDHGPILAQKRIVLEDWPPPARVLHDALARGGGALLSKTIPLWIRGKITPKEQDHEHATYTKMIRKKDGLIDLSGNTYQNYLKILAFDTWPGTYFFVERGGKKIRVKITKALLRNGTLDIITVIPEGKKEMKYADFKRSFG